MEGWRQGGLFNALRSFDPGGDAADERCIEIYGRILKLNCSRFVFLLPSNLWFHLLCSFLPVRTKTDLTEPDLLTCPHHHTSALLEDV